LIGEVHTPAERHWKDGELAACAGRSIKRSGGAFGQEGALPSTAGRLVCRDGRLAPPSTTGAENESTPPQRAGTMSSVTDASPECLGAERRIDRCDGDVARAGVSADPLTEAGAKSRVASRK